MQGFAAVGVDPEIRATVRQRFGDLVMEVGGVGPGDVRAFFANGMLLNIMAALDLQGDGRPHLRPSRQRRPAALLLVIDIQRGRPRPRPVELLRARTASVARSRRRCVRECPFPDMRRIENPHGIELRTARRGGFSGHVPRRKRERTLGRGRAVGSAPATVTDAVSDIATPVCIRQTAPALVKERARVLRCRRARLGRSAGALREAPARDEDGTLKGRLLCAALATPRGSGTTSLGPVWVREPHGFPVNAGYCGGPARVRKAACLQRYSVRDGRCGYCLAMQKVEGSNPISRSREGKHLQVFFVGAVGWCVCVAPDRNRTRG